jgi:alpha-L-fucosidase
VKPAFMKFLLRVLGVSLGLWCTCHLYGVKQPDDPTGSDSPEHIDQIWRQASSKYDSPRDAILQRVENVVQQGPFRADWNSLRHYETPDWFRDSKFGIFIHWGLYSVPAFGSEWYPRDMYRAGSEEYKHHLATYGPLDKFGYKDFVPLFKAERFDPHAWARLFKDSGARYVVPVFEHHDGFAIYDSGLSEWTAAKMGPHRDLAGELAQAVREEGLYLGASFHRVEHNFFFDCGRMSRSDVNDPRFAAFYGPAHAWLKNPSGTPVSNDFTYVSTEWTNDWLARSAEIVEKYHPELMWFDWWIGQPSVRGAITKFAAFYYNSSVQKSGNPGVINYKYFAMEGHSAVLDIERGQLDHALPQPWQTDTSVSNKSWGYIENDTFKSADFVVHELVDIVSKNGNLLLNVGPRADGTIPDEVQQILLEVGAWLKVNGEAIYGTRPWTVYGGGPTKVASGAFHDTDTAAYTAEDFRFTTRNGILYAIELGRSVTPNVIVHALTPESLGLGRKVQSVHLLGSDQSLIFQQLPDGLHIRFPANLPGKYAYVVRIDFVLPERAS